MHLAAQKIGIGHGCSNLRGGIAHAKANLQHQRGLPAKDSGVVGRRVLVRQQKCVAPLLQRLALPRSNAPRAQHKTANSARVGNACWRGWLGVRRGVCLRVWFSA